MRTVELVQMVKVPFRGRTELMTKDEAENLRNQLSAVLFCHASEFSTIDSYVCAHFGVTERDMFSHRRHERICWPRQVAMYLCRRLTTHSLADIGEHFDRDHGTILYGVRLVESRMVQSEQTHAEIEALEKLIIENPNGIRKELAA